MVSVMDNIGNGVYEHKIPYTKENRDVYEAETTLIEELFRDHLFEEFDVKNNPKAQKCYSMAWNYGHSSGYSEVYIYFEELVELIKLIKPDGGNKLTAKDVLEYQNRVDKLKVTNSFTAGNFKDLGIELRDKFGLTDREAIDILNGKNDTAIGILARD